MKVVSIGTDPRRTKGLNPRLIVRLVEPVHARRYGPVVLLRMSFDTSCTWWGREKTPAYAVLRAVGQIGSQELFEAAVYRRSWLDDASRSVGIETFLASGAPLEWPAR
jgi:hypothetical protein